MAQEEKQDIYKIVLIGDMNVGKTHLLTRYLKEQNPKVQQPTIGVEFATKTIKFDDQKEVTVQFWDTAGQERYKAITQSHFRKAVGALLVYDITKIQSYDNVSKWMEDVKYGSEPEIEIILIGNKQDLAVTDPSKRKVPTQDAQQFADENNLEFMETSALDDTLVKKAFKKLLDKVYLKKQQKKNTKTILELKKEPIQEQRVQQQPCSC